MKRKCICKDIEILDIKIKLQSNYFYYEIKDELKYLYNYHIYLKLNDNVPIATFTKLYFDYIFDDIIIERNKKIKKINEKRS